MSASPLVGAVRSRLLEAGFVDVETPLRVAGVEFAFTTAMRGQNGRALDLVLVFDTTTGSNGDRDAGRIRQRVEALGRALDVTGSRYVVTAILAGAALTVGVEALAEVCRVLTVDEVPLDSYGDPVDPDARRSLDDQILLLLPLTLPPSTTTEGNGGEAAMEQLVKALPKSVDRALVAALVDASERGEDAVATAVAVAVARPLAEDPEGAEK